MFYSSNSATLLPLARHNIYNIDLSRLDKNNETKNIIKILQRGLKYASLFRVHIFTLKCSKVFKACRIAILFVLSPIFETTEKFHWFVRYRWEGLAQQSTIQDDDESLTLYISPPCVDTQLWYTVYIFRTFPISQL